jgi:DNA modification methylase
MPDPNRLYYGDNLDIMRRHIADESVDLIYLDPLYPERPRIRRRRSQCSVSLNSPAQ